jgi:acyl-CoA reductase-like NAD-dependent aldehyde dehydrogenase
MLSLRKTPGFEEFPHDVDRDRRPLHRMKLSGGGRELGLHALDYYTEVKNVFVSTEED